jgi:hypothetical protein
LGGKEILMQMTGEEKKEKEFIFKKYLQELVEGCVVKTKWADRGIDLLFRIDDADGKIKHHGKVTDEFLAYTKAEEIPKELDKLKLKNSLDMAEKKEVLISTNGIEIKD